MKAFSLYLLLFAGLDAASNVISAASVATADVPLGFLLAQALHDPIYLGFNILGVLVLAASGAMLSQ